MNAPRHPRPARFGRLTVIAALLPVAVAGCGGSGSSPTTTVGPNASQYGAGPKRDIGTVIDELQADARSGNADAICHQLFTDKLSGTIAARNNTSCADQVSKKLVRKDASFKISSIKVRGAQAIAKVTDFTGATNGMYFVKQDTWKLDSIYNLGK